MCQKYIILTVLNWHALCILLSEGFFRQLEIITGETKMGHLLSRCKGTWKCAQHNTGEQVTGAVTLDSRFLGQSSWWPGWTTSIFVYHTMSGRSRWLGIMLLFTKYDQFFPLSPCSLGRQCASNKLFTLIHPPSNSKVLVHWLVWPLHNSLC